MKKLFSAFLVLQLLIFIDNCMCQWVPSSNGIPSEQYVTSLGVSGNVLYAATSGGIFKSSDAGMNWFQILSFTGTIYSLAFSGNYIYAGANDGIWKSTNSGINWSKITFYGSPAIWSVSCSNGNAYATLWAENVYKSTDNGVIWFPVSPIGDSRAVSANEPYVYAGYYNYTGLNGGVYRSVNAGLNWTITLTDKSIYCLSQSDSTVYAGAVDDILRTGGVYVSYNYGLDWIRSSLDSVPVKTLYAYGNYIFAGVDNSYYPGFTEHAGFWASTDRGQTWTKRNEGFSKSNTNLPVVAIVVLNNNVFTAISGGIIWKRPLSQVISVLNISSEIPMSDRLYQNYPNPFNPSTIIRYQIKDKSKVSLKLYDISGKEVAALVNENQNPGIYEVQFNVSGISGSISSGVYFCKLTTNKFTQTKRMIIIK